MIEPSTLSVVLQGPLHEGLTARAVQSVRRYFPGAEAILSTWEGSEIGTLECDQVILSKDPGGLPQVHDPRFFWNVNRQIVSTAAGLAAARRPFAVKLRTDMLLGGTGFLQESERYPARSPEYAHFAHRVVAPLSVNPWRGSSLFMPGDWFSFGKTDDLRLLWDVPLSPEPETSQYYLLHPEENRARDPVVNRFTAEQYICISSLRKKFEVPMRHRQDYSPEAMLMAEKVIANNFILLEPEQIGLLTPRHTIAKGAWASHYSFAEWRKLYRKYCDPHAAAPFDWTRGIRRAVLAALMLRERLTGRRSGVDLSAARALAAWPSPRG